MDDINRQIIKMLQENARMPVKEIAKKVKLSYTAAFMRIAKLEKNKFILKYSARLDRKKLDRNIMAFITVKVDQYKGRPEEDRKKLLALKEVETLDFTTGDWDIFIRAGFKDMAHLEEFLHETLPKALPHGTRNQTMLILEHNFKEMEPL
ncbi:MAG: Lrp/AsnC family transcriptional regulator [DPANN group archaeon]|nr:Lrp/AsnC family transcriptional regulator [DPANN group archaeon]